MFLLIFRYVFGGAIGVGARALRRLPRARLHRHVGAVRRRRRGGRRRRGRRAGLLRPAPLAAHPPRRPCSPAERSPTPACWPGASSSRRRSGSPSASASTGASPPRSPPSGSASLFGFAFGWVFITLGLVAGNAQAAQGLSLLVFPLTFVSSAYVPVSTMPSWMQAFADHQPLTPMVDAVRSLTLGPSAQAVLGHSTALLRHVVAAVVRRPRGRVRPARHLALREGLSLSAGSLHRFSRRRSDPTRGGRGSAAAAGAAAARAGEARAGPLHVDAALHAQRRVARRQGRRPRAAPRSGRSPMSSWAASSLADGMLFGIGGHLDALHRLGHRLLDAGQRRAASARRSRRC